MNRGRNGLAGGSRLSGTQYEIQFDSAVSAGKQLDVIRLALDECATKFSGLSHEVEEGLEKERAMLAKWSKTAEQNSDEMRQASVCIITAAEGYRDAEKLVYDRLSNRGVVEEAGNASGGGVISNGGGAGNGNSTDSAGGGAGTDQDSGELLPIDRQVNPFAPEFSTSHKINPLATWGTTKAEPSPHFWSKLPKLLDWRYILPLLVVGGGSSSNIRKGIWKIISDILIKKKDEKDSKVVSENNGDGGADNSVDGDRNPTGAHIGKGTIDRPISDFENLLSEIAAFVGGGESALGIWDGNEIDWDSFVVGLVGGLIYSNFYDDPNIKGGTNGDGSNGDGTSGDGANDGGTNSDGTSDDGANSDGTNSDGTSDDGANGDGTNSDGTSDDGINDDGTNEDGLDENGLGGESLDSDGVNRDTSGGGGGGKSSSGGGGGGTTTAKPNMEEAENSSDEIPITNSEDFSGGVIDPEAAEVDVEEAVEGMSAVELPMGGDTAGGSAGLGMAAPLIGAASVASMVASGLGIQGAQGQGAGDGDGLEDSKPAVVEAKQAEGVFAGDLKGNYVLIGSTLALLFSGASITAGVRNAKNKDRKADDRFRTGYGVSAVLSGGAIQERRAE